MAETRRSDNVDFLFWDPAVGTESRAVDARNVIHMFRGGWRTW
jgi:hypothetical protein